MSANSLLNSSIGDNSEDKVDKTSVCIRKVANFSNMKPNFQIDNKAFNPELMNMIIDEASPKLRALFDKISELDANDFKTSGKLYKHFIYSDVLTPAFGAKLIASSFIAKGSTSAFTETMRLKNQETLLKSKDQNFGMLMSKSIYGKNMSQKIRKEMCSKYNERPDNINGELMRFIILDSGFREGIDLFDVKYVHLFEPLLVKSDEKQSIGRATRFCGQKGLTFHPKHGWPLYVFKYDIEFKEKIEDTKTMFELYLKYSDIDIKKVVFAAELENVVIDAAVDKELNKEIHSFKIGGGNLNNVNKNIKKNFMEYKYPHVKLENKCEEKIDNAITFTPTQEFIRNYFNPQTNLKGMLMFHGVGTGKTCSAISTATTGFNDYTIVWVTRHTLKSDIWKNMFKQICNMNFIRDKRKFPNKKHLSKNWIEPMSYKQFSNMLLEQNKFHKIITDKNGTEDPLKKTLLIIDEAHKLYTKTGPKSEQPRLDILEEMIDHSYKTSGKDSVRILLMTATPYTDDAMEMIKLLNLIREKKLVSEFDDFSEKYLDDNGYFTKKGKISFQDDIAGYVSYINRSQDARNFAYPVIESIYAPMTYHEDRVASKSIDIEIKDLTVKSKSLRAIIRDEKPKCKSLCQDLYKDQLDKCEEDKACIKALKSNKKNILNDCLENQCADLNVSQKELNETLQIKEQKQLFIKNITLINKNIIKENKELKETIKTLRLKKQGFLADKKLLKNKKPINLEIKKLLKEYADVKSKLSNNNDIKTLNRIKMDKAVLPDYSTDTMLKKKCFKS